MFFVIRWFLAAAFAILVSISTGLAQGREGWSRQALETQILRVLDRTKLDKKTVPEIPENVFLMNTDEKAECFVGENDYIEAINGYGQSSFALIGDGRFVHTIWFYFPIVSERNSEDAFEYYEDFFTTLFPEWDEAAAWPRSSLISSWSYSTRAYRDPMISFEDMITRHRVGDVALSAMGFPPDLVVYRATVRTDCEKISEFSKAKPRKVLRNPELRDDDRRQTPLELHNVTPKAIDLTDTPIFLGRVSGISLDDKASEVVQIKARSTYPALDIHLGQWFMRQLNSPDASVTEEFIAEGWGYERRFLMRIMDPEVSVRHDSGSLSIVANSVSGSIEKIGSAEFNYSWRRLYGLAFSDSLPNWTWQDGRVKEPPYRRVNEGHSYFENEGAPKPVDISNTPVYRGTLRENDSELLISKLPEAKLEITETSKSEKVILDLGDWARQQEGESFGENRAQPVTQPKIDFVLNDAAYRIVVRSANFRTTSGKLDLKELTGYLFSDE